MTDPDSYADAQAERDQEEAHAWARERVSLSPDAMARAEGFTFWD